MNPRPARPLFRKRFAELEQIVTDSGGRAPAGIEQQSVPVVIDRAFHDDF